MAGNDNGNLVQDFEEAFQTCIASLTEEEELNEKDSESNLKNLEEKVSRFTDVARQLETFFLAKRFLIHNHKPEYILKEDTNDLKAELVRKDELIRKHYEKLGQWQNMLADVQSSGQGAANGLMSSQAARGQPPAPAQGAQGAASHQGGAPVPGGGLGGPGGVGQGAGAGVPPGAMPGPGAQTPHGSFVPSNNYSRQPNTQMFGGQGQQVGQQSLQGPLAYLERTTSNIGGGFTGGPGPLGMNNR